MLRRLRKRSKRVYVNINNHFEGSAPLTAAKVKDLLKGKGIGDIPSKLDIDNSFL
jgi:uncharacterized protein YecE (DUF72 family)